MKVLIADDHRLIVEGVKGALASIEQRDTVVAKLEAHGCFRDIQRGRTSPGRTADQINYQIEAKLQCPGEGPAKKRKKTSSDE